MASPADAGHEVMSLLDSALLLGWLCRSALPFESAKVSFGPRHGNSVRIGLMLGIPPIGCPLILPSNVCGPGHGGLSAGR